MKKDLFKPDMRKRFHSELPPRKDLVEIFAFDFQAGELWFLDRPREHFKTDAEWKEWNDTCPQPIEGDPEKLKPMHILFTYKGEWRECLAARIVFGLLGIYIGPDWGFAWRDGNGSNSHLLNLKIIHPTAKGEFGFLSEMRNTESMTFLGTFPTKNGQFQVLSWEQPLNILTIEDGDIQD